MTAPLPSLVLYGRPGCHLCEDARAIVEGQLKLRADRGQPVPVLEHRNIESDDAWHRRYMITIPVVAFGDRELELATSPAKLGRFLAEVLDGAAADATRAPENTGQR